MMAKNNFDGNNNTSSNRSTPDKYQKINNNNSNLKKTPSPRVRSPETRTSPRQSPGLIAGHYAGCKWSEPPSPSTLPSPPQHWMQQLASPSTTITPVVQYSHHHEKQNVAQLDIANQLKVLLKVQA